MKYKIRISYNSANVKMIQLNNGMANRNKKFLKPGIKHKKLFKKKARMLIRALHKTLQMLKTENQP